MSTATTQPVLMSAGDMAVEFGCAYEMIADIIQARQLTPTHEGPRRYDAEAIGKVRAALASMRGENTDAR